MTAALAEDPRGLKRICPNCGTHYYDLNKRPIVCPACSSEFSMDVKVKTRRSRVVAEPTAIVKENKDAIEDEDLLEEDDTEAAIVSLEDLDEDDGEDDDTNLADDDLDEDEDDLDVDMDDDDLSAGIDDLDDDEDDIDIPHDKDNDR